MNIQTSTAFLQFYVGFVEIANIFVFQFIFKIINTFFDCSVFIVLRVFSLCIMYSIFSSVTWNSFYAIQNKSSVFFIL